MANAGCIRCNLFRKEITRIIPDQHPRYIYTHQFDLGRTSIICYKTTVKVATYLIATKAKRSCHLRHSQ